MDSVKRLLRALCDSDTLASERVMRSSRNVLHQRASWTVTVLLLSGLAISVLASQQTASLRLVSTAWPPFTNPPGQPRFALDLVEAALGRVGLSAKTTIVGAAQFTPLLLSGQFDGSAAAWKDAERERSLIFSQPYLENRLVLVGRHGADVSAKTISDLKGKRVALVEGYSYGDAIDSAGPVFVRSQSEEDSLAQLLKGGVDYTLMDELVVHYIVNNYPKESGSRLQIGSTPLVTRELYLAVTRARADAQSIIDRFNTQLRGMIADRTYHRLLHVDWIRADINGDGVSEYVPSNDQIGPSEPQRIYTLFTAPKPVTKTPAKPGFYIGGNIYMDWASVPQSYKDINKQPPDPRRSTASIFRFTW
jgi:polar amino acid transport system substrate-binding protein